MSLIERASGLSSEFRHSADWVDAARKALAECAAVMTEQETQIAALRGTTEILHQNRRDLQSFISERDQEIRRLKNAKDHRALSRAWSDGYVTAASHAAPVIGNLLAVAQKKPQHEEPHTHEH